MRDLWHVTELARDCRCYVHKSAAVALVASVASAFFAKNLEGVYKCGCSRQLETITLSDGAAAAGDEEKNSLKGLVASRRGF